MFDTHGSMERQLLAACLSTKESKRDACLAYVTEHIGQQHFRDPRNGVIYAAMCDLFRAGEPVHIVSLVEALRIDGSLDKVGGISAVTALTSEIAGSYEYLAGRVLRNSALAAVHDIGETLAQQAAQEQEEPETLAAAALATLSEIATRQEPGGADAGRQYVEQLADRLERKAARPSVPTGYTSWDAVMGGGLQLGGLHILAARPSMGKTALSLNVALKAARAGKRVLYFSMEQSADAVRDRLTAAISKIPLSCIVTPSTIAPENYEQSKKSLLSAARELSELPLAVVDGARSAEQIAGRMMYEEQERGGLDLVCVDYLGLVQIPGKQSRVHELGAAAKALKAAAIRQGVAVLLLCQLSRNVDARPANDRVPVLADLRDSGEIEEAADSVAMLYRPGYYDDTASSSEARLHIRKNRDGKLGEVHFTFNRARMWFVEARPEGAAAFGGRQLSRREGRDANAIADMVDLFNERRI